MKTNFLFPYRFKKIGWILFIPSVVLGLLYLIFDFTPDFLHVKALFLGESGLFYGSNDNLIDEIAGVFIIVSSLMIAFSKEKTEDEFLSRIRLESLVWATYVNYIVLILGILLVYGMTFFYILIVNMFTILFFFIIRFNWVLYKLKKSER